MLSTKQESKNFLESCKLLLVYLQTTKLLLIIKKNIKSFYICPGKLNCFVTALKIESTFFRIFTAKAVKGALCGWGAAGSRGL